MTRLVPVWPRLTEEARHPAGLLLPVPNVRSQHEKIAERVGYGRCGTGGSLASTTHRFQRRETVGKPLFPAA